MYFILRYSMENHANIGAMGIIQRVGNRSDEQHAKHWRQSEGGDKDRADRSEHTLLPAVRGGSWDDI